MRRRIRRLAISGAVLACIFLVGAGFSAIRRELRSSFNSPINSAWSQGNTSDHLAALATSGAVASIPAHSERRVVYPYSVVPGGAHSVKELKAASERDPVVARHYAGFDFPNARIVEVSQPKLVYLSYRMGNKVFWSRKRVALHKGEKVLTDGKIVARTRCANQVSESPKGEISPAEPTMQSLEQPVGDGTATQIPYPGNFESALMSHSPLDGLLSGLPPGSTGTGLFGGPGGGGFPPISPPLIPTSNSPEPPPPPAVPEPGTIVLVTSGIAGIYLRYRNRARQ